MSKLVDNLQYILKESKTRYLTSIAKELKINVNSLYAYFDENNIPRKSFLKITPENSKKLFEFIKERDYNSFELAKKTGLTPGEVSRWARNNKIKLKNANIRIHAELEDKVKALISEGVIFHDICKKLKLAPNVLYRWEKDVKIEIPRQSYKDPFIKRLKEQHPHLTLIEYNPQGSSLYQCEKGHTFYRNASNIWKTGYCPKCSKPKSKTQNEISEWLRGLNLGLELKLDKRVLKTDTYPLEIDIYLPEKRAGIELHGLHWHTEDKVPSRYHQFKAKQAQAQDIQLIQVWEHEWQKNTSICKSLILNKLGYSPSKIYARNLKIKELGKKEANEFLKSNHLQGYSNSIFCVGLVDEWENIISVLTFRKHKEGLELARFCTKKYRTVVGGFQKLLKYGLTWAKSQGYHKIITFADYRYSWGKVYEKAGFKFEYLTDPDWFWFKDSGTGKGSIKNRRISWGKKVKDFRDQGWRKIHGAGHLKFSLDF